jgi:tRNA wybutosine-synthesizing protein 1
MNKKVKNILKRQHYAIVGNHSAVQLCFWTKNSLNEKGVCWKEKFYGVNSHRCCQMSPAVMWCHNQCLHCWRAIEYNLGTKLPKIDSPKKIIEGVIKARKKLLSGFYGNEKVDKNKLKKAETPSLFTFSLSGEPTIYPKLGELIKEVRKRNAISFLVTNGLEPEKINKLQRENALPTQITVSTNAPNQRLFKIWHRSMKKNAWREFNKTLGIINKLKGKTRRVIRLTLVKKGKGERFRDKLSNMNPEHAKEYAELIIKANPDFVHVKAFKSLGYARKRFGYDKMPLFSEIKDFSKKLLKELKKEDKRWKKLAEDERSTVVLIGKNKSKMKIRKKDI